MEKRLARFGYVEAEARADNLLFRRGERPRGHEFHYSSASGEAPGAFRVRKALKASLRPGDEWDEGYLRSNLLASYVHFNLWGFPEAAARFLAAARSPEQGEGTGAPRFSGIGGSSLGDKGAGKGISRRGPDDGRSSPSVGTPRLARALMVCGTTSDAGKSFLVTGLCRLFARRGIRVAPFKAQNMALNAYVAPDGGEMGIAQAVQAEAAGLEPDVRFNPVLLKPQGDSISQVVCLGRVVGVSSASEYHRDRWREAWEVARGALAELRREYDLIILEGAGSPAEMNLYEADMANVRSAAEAEAPILLAADVERGGAIASLLGTLWVLPPEDAARIVGFVVNRFRGDPRLFDGAVEFLQERSGRPVLGVLPYDPALRLPAEDSLNLKDFGDGPIRIAVAALSHIANFTDFDAFADEGCRICFARTGADLAGADLVVLPGTKTTLADLRRLRSSGLAEAVLAAAAAGTPIWGICGGYQMLGERVADPEGFEERGEASGLGLLPVETIFAAEKVTLPVRARFGAAEGFWSFLTGREVRGYEIHSGRSSVRGGALVRILERGGKPLDSPGVPDGAVDASGTVMGCHLHGIADDPAFRRPLVDALRARRHLPPLSRSPRTGREIRSEGYDRLADLLEAHLDMDRLISLIGLPRK
jgi:adenosylcobyric acid synthase